jgi:hypothetical protein
MALVQSQQITGKGLGEIPGPLLFLVALSAMSRFPTRPAMEELNWFRCARCTGTNLLRPAYQEQGVVMRPRLLATILLAAAVGASAIPAFADKDNVQFGSTIRVSPGETVHDTICFFCSVDDRGTINGDVVVFFGDVRIDGKANHDVVNFFGDVTASEGSSIGQDLVKFFGSVRLGDNVTVGKDIVCMFADFRAGENVTNGGDRVVQPPWLFWTPLLVLMLILFVIVHEIRQSRRRRMYMAGYPFPPQPPRP